MKFKDIQQTKEWQTDWNQCTLVASSVAFNIDYKKIHQFYLDNGRQKNKGLLPFHTERIIRKLAKTEGYKVTLFKPIIKEGSNIRKWVSGSNDYSQGIRIVADFKPDNKEKLCVVDRHITPNNQDQVLPIGNYIMGVSGHVIGINKGIVEDWTDGKKHRATSIYKIEKTGEKVKRQTFSSAFDDVMNFDF